MAAKAALRAAQDGAYGPEGACTAKRAKSPTSGRRTKKKSSARPSPTKSRSSQSRKRTTAPKRKQIRVGSYVTFDPAGYTSNQIQGGKIMERFTVRGPLGTEEVVQGTVDHSRVRTAYCVRFNGNPSVYTIKLADALTPITAAQARKMNKKLTGSARLPGAEAPVPPSRCGKPY